MNSNRLKTLFVQVLDRRTMVQTWNWALYSAAFAVLFNLVAPWGIALRESPPTIPPPCQQGVVEPHTGYIVTHPATPPRPSRLSLSGVRMRYGHEGVVFLDARPKTDYLRGHIAGALSFDVNDFVSLAPEVLPLLASSKEIISYCSGGHCADSIELAAQLKEVGYPGVKVFEEGLGAWKDAGLPIQKGEKP